jgi:hypothetical protein
MLPAGPLAPRRGPALAWTGREMLISGGADASGGFFLGNGAAFDPQTNRWRLIAPTLGRFVPTSAWTGSQFLVWGGIVITDASGHFDASSMGARFTP